MRSNPGMGVSLLLLFCLCVGGCQQTISHEEQQKIAKAYAEMLIAKNMVTGDSASAQRSVDSVVKSYGFDNEEELQNELKRLTANPDQFRQTLDSAQRIMEAAQNEPADKMSK